MASSVASTLAGMGVNTPGGSTSDVVNKGAHATAGSGVHSEGPAPKAPSRAPQKAPQPRQPAVRPPQPKQPQPRPYSAQNPPMGTPAPAPPHPGVAPPYPDARSPQPVLMPNGVPVMPPPPGFPLANAAPRVPPAFAPGMSGLLGKLRS